jgi:hypothetical protein
MECNRDKSCYGVSGLVRGKPRCSPLFPLRDCHCETVKVACLYGMLFAGASIAGLVLLVVELIP